MNLTESRRDQLGQSFGATVRNVALGSFELWVTVGAAYGIYQGISHWKDFVESVELLVSQFRSVLRALISARLTVFGLEVTTHSIVTAVKPQDIVTVNRRDWVAVYLVVTQGLLVALLGAAVAILASS